MNNHCNLSNIASMESTWRLKKYPRKLNMSNSQGSRSAWCGGVSLFTLKDNCGTCHAGWAIKNRVISDSPFVSPFLTLPKLKKYILPFFKEKRISEVVRIGSIIIFHRVSYEKPSSPYCVMWEFWWGCRRNLTLIRTLVYPASWISRFDHKIQRFRIFNSTVWNRYFPRNRLNPRTRPETLGPSCGQCSSAMAMQTEWTSR